MYLASLRMKYGRQCGKMVRTQRLELDCFKLKPQNNALPVLPAVQMQKHPRVEVFFVWKVGLDDAVCVKLMEMMVAEIVMCTREKYTWSLVPERPPLCTRCYDDIGQNVHSEFFIRCYRKTGTEFLANPIILNHCWNRSWIHFLFPMTSSALYQTRFSLLPHRSLAPPQSNPQSSEFHS